MLRLMQLLAAALEVELIGTVEAFEFFVCRSSIECMHGFRDQLSYDFLLLLLCYGWKRSSASLM